MTDEVMTETGEVKHLELGVVCMMEMIRKKVTYILKTI